MPIQLITKKKTLHFTKEKKEVYVATPDRGDIITPDKIAQFVAQDTGARVAQVKMILNSLTNSMLAWIEEGHGVRLGNLGSFLPSVKCSSSENSDEVEVKKVKLTFIASKELREKVKNVKYNMENIYKDPATDDNTDETEPDTGGSDPDTGGTEME